MAGTNEKQRLLAQLHEAGQRRATANRHRREGLEQLATAYEDIRVYAAEAGRLGLTRTEIAAAVGVSRQQLRNIIVGATAV